MIDSFVIFAKTGTVLYHYGGNDNNGNSNSNDMNVAPPTDLLNQFIETVFLGQHSVSLKQDKVCSLAPTSTLGAGNAAADTVVSEWEESAPKDQREWVAVVFYKAVLQNRLNYIRALLRMVLQEYAMFYDSISDKENDDSGKIYIANHSPPSDAAQQKFTSTFLALQKKAELQSKQQPQIQFAPQTLPQRNSAHDLKNVGGPKKKQTVWHDGKQKVTAEAMASLDYSKPSENPEEEAEARLKRELAEARAAYLPSDSEVPMWEQQEEELQDEDVAFMNNTSDEQNGGTSSDTKGGWGSSLIGLWDQMAGNKVLTEEDIEPICQQMKDLMVSKNVAHATATEICSLVQKQLVGKRLKSFGRIQTAVRTSLENAIAKLLTPHRPVDVLRDVISKRDRQQGGTFGRRGVAAKPYVVVFVGINGVGKSSKLVCIFLWYLHIAAFQWN
jgi:signal recognition particle GTPase